jgi:outer membrane protein assembly factor BamB
MLGVPDMSNATIELGEDWSIDDDQPVLIVRPAIRRCLAVLAVLLGLLLGGSTPKPTPALEPLFTVPGPAGDIVMMDNETLYVATNIRAPGGRLSAYRLPTGVQAWSVELASALNYFDLVPGRGTLLAFLGGDSPDIGAVQALDAVTGQPLWRAESDARVVVRPLVAGRLLNAVFSPDDKRPIEQRPATLTATDARSGRPVWSTGRTDSYPAIGYAEDVTGAATRIVPLRSDGTLQVLAAETGTLLASVRLTIPANPTDVASQDEPHGPSLSVVGDQVMLSYRASGGPLLVAYDLVTLAERWRVVVPSVIFQIQACGAVLCAMGDRLSAVDPHTGRLLWQTPGWAFAELAAGHLFVTGSEPSGAWGMVDPQTGRDLLSLTGWTRPMSRDQTVKPLVTMRAAGQLDRVWVAMVEVGVPAARALGQLTGVRSDQCWQTAGYLACRRWSLDVAVWRYPVR